MNAPLSHVVLGTNSMENAERFYTPLLAMLGWRRRLSDSSPDKLLWQPATATRPLFGVLKPFDRKPQQVGNGAMVALNAPDRLTVDAVYELALTLGASCDGPPGLRTHYHPNYYGAYFRDLDGNKLCVVCHLAPVTCASGMLSRAAMIENARSWIAAWNRRDVEAVLAGFHPDATFRSPIAEKTLGYAELTGVSALRDYWTKALAGVEMLQFTLVDVVCDETRQSMVVVYIAALGAEVRQACEIFRFKDGRKISGEALYSCWA